jgi:hypothetical protein
VVYSGAESSAKWNAAVRSYVRKSFSAISYLARLQRGSSFTKQINCPTANPSPFAAYSSNSPSGKNETLPGLRVTERRPELSIRNALLSARNE